MPPAAKTKSGSAALGGGLSPLAQAREYLIKKQGKEFTDIRVSLDADSLAESLPHISSGCDVVDYLIGGSPNKFGVPPCPGFPRGRVSQIWGHESAGKTTLALQACASVIAAGGTCLYVDWENDIVPDYAAALGVPITDPNKFELLQPETLEDGIKYAATYAAAGVDLIVFDSVGAAIPRRLAERDALDVAEQGKIGELQSVWSQELPNLKRVIARTGTAVIGISQIRAKIGGMGNGPTTQPQGGNAWKFYSSVRLELRRVQNEKQNELNDLTHKVEERVIGGIIKVTAIKCKMSRSQGHEEIFYIRWGEGIDNVRSMMEIAIAHGLIKKAGAGWITWNDAPKGPLKLQGSGKLRDYLLSNPDAYEALRSRVKPLLGQGAAAKFVDETDEEGVVDPFEAKMKAAGVSMGEEEEEDKDLSEEVD
jgi:recombination protein RecA